MDKASEECIDILHLWESCEEGKCWLTAEQVKIELDKLTGITAKKNTLEEQITIRVKGFGWSEYQCQVH